jgi:xanthine dehydrogenase small subunit
MTDAVRFLLNGEVHETRPNSPTDTVLDFLRERRGLKGSKEGCAEGDCGACTVVLGEPDGDQIRYRAINSCILFLPALDGKQLITVEDLAQPESGLHAVQQAMVDCHGSQCGFCTPGIVMSLFALFHEQPEQRPDRPAIEAALSGNLCRCTGYAPILQAAEQSLTPGRQDQFDRDLPATLSKLAAVAPLTHRELQTESGTCYAPVSLDELWTLVTRHPHATLVAGATDVGLWVTKRLEDPPAIILTTGVRELQRLVFDKDRNALEIGATVTYTESMDKIGDLYPGFLPVIRRLGGWQVRNAGTIGGNIANGSPIGDMPPGLIAAGARLLLSSAAGSREIPLEDFFLGYGKQDLRPGEIVEAVLLPSPGPDLFFRTWKVSKRFEQDISAVCGAFALELSEGQVQSARVCFGGMAATPRRADHCEAALEGRPWNTETLNSAMQALTKDYQPISDMRASAGYRLSVARNLLHRFFLESTDPGYNTGLAPRHEQAR